MKTRFDVLNKITGEIEPFTGVFQNEQKTGEWIKKYGKLWKQRGYNLIRVDIEKGTRRLSYRNKTDKTELSAFGKKRIANKIRQWQISDLAGCSQTHVSRIERELFFPSIDFMKRLNAILDYLIEEKK